MFPIPLDIIGFSASYFIMLQFYEAMQQHRSHSLILRLLATIVAYVLVLFFIDYFLNVFLISLQFYTSANMGTAVVWFGLALLTGLLIRLYAFRPEKLNIDEMTNFIGASLRFGNYFRLRDVDTREQIGTYTMKKTFEEVHGKPFDESILATPFDQKVTTFKRVPIEALREKKKHYPPEYFEELTRLKNNERTDVSVSFRFELLGSSAHPFLPYVDRCIIDPSKRVLSMEIVFPSEKIVPLELAAHRTRLAERVHEMLHVINAMEWFELYRSAFGQYAVTCVQQEFTDTMEEGERTMMAFAITHHQLMLRSGKITTFAEIEKLAQITFPTH